MVRRHAGKLAAIAIAVLVASVVWRARRRVGAVASDGVTDDLSDTAAPADHDDPIELVDVEHVDVEHVEHVEHGDDGDVVGEPVAAARVFMAAEAPPVEDDAAPAEPEPEPGPEPAAEDPIAAEPEPEPELVAGAVEPEPEPAPELDLALIERELAGVEAALRRLDDGTYWTDEVTGEPIDELVLAADPVARRNT